MRQEVRTCGFINSIEPTSHLRQSASRLSETWSHLRIPSHLLTAPMLSSTNRYPLREPVLTRFDYGDFPSSRRDVEWDSGRAGESVNGVKHYVVSPAKEECKLSPSCCPPGRFVSLDRIWGTVLDRVNSVNRYCGSSDKPTWTSWRTRHSLVPDWRHPRHVPSFIGFR